MNQTIAPPKHVFTRYQIFVIVIAALLQFTVILDFMVMSPLGVMLIRILKIQPSQFGWVVSAYAFAAAVSGILAAGFADKFDRKKLLLVFYTGFVLGTLLCGIAPDYKFLLMARAFTGFFSGLVMAANMAIITDLFPIQVRGRVMGFVQMAFAVSQVAGLPIGLLLANKFGWHMPFLMIVAFCIPIGIAIIIGMKPVTEHLKATNRPQNPFQHLIRTASQRKYLQAFFTTVFLSTGGFLMMPYATTFLVHNVGLKETDMSLIFMVAGAAGLVTGPLIGRFSDKWGKYNFFIGGSLAAIILVQLNTHLGITPLWIVIILNTLMYTAVFSRMIPSQALISGIPELTDRGAFMSINSSVQQLGGGVASAVGGMIIAQNSTGQLLHYDILGYVTNVAIILCVIMMYFVNRYIKRQANIARGRGAQPAAKDNLAIAAE